MVGGVGLDEVIESGGLEEVVGGGGLDEVVGGGGLDEVVRVSDELVRGSVKLPADDSLLY